MRCIAISPAVKHLTDMLNRQIGANIKAVRESRKPKMSLEKLAARIDPPTKYQTLGKLEKGARPITMEWVERIAKGLDVDPLVLLAPELLRAQPEAIAAEPLILSEQVADQAARTLAAAALGAEPSTDTVRLVSGLLRDLVALFSAHPEAASDLRVARPALDLAGSRYVHAVN